MCQADACRDLASPCCLLAAVSRARLFSLFRIAAVAATQVIQASLFLQVVPVFAGGLDFSAPVKKFFYDPIYKSTAFVDCIVSLTG